MGATKSNSCNYGLTKDSSNIHLFSSYDGYEPMQKECARQAQLLRTKAFKKYCLRTESLHSELHLKTSISLLYLLSYELRTYFKTAEAQSIGFCTAKALLALECSSSKGSSHSSEHVVPLR